MTHFHPYWNAVENVHRDEEHIVIEWKGDAGGKNATLQLKLDDENAVELIERLEVVVESDV